MVDLKNPSLSKAVTQALQHVDADSRAVAREVDQRVAADITEWQHEHPLWEVDDDGSQER